MAVSFIAVASGVTSVASMPAHQAGDLLVAYAFRDGSTTAPSLVSGWTSVYGAGLNTCSLRIAYKWAASGAEVSGTWTSASRVVIAVYRGVNTETPVGGFVTNSASSTSVTYSALAGTDPASSSWFSCFAGHRSVNVTLENPPTDATLRHSIVDATAEAALFDTAGSLASWTSRTVAVGGTASGWMSIVLEIKEYRPVELSGSDVQIGVEPQSGVYTEVVPTSSYTYARVGVLEYGAAVGDIDIPYAGAPMSRNSDNVPTSDRAKHTFGGEARAIPVSDRAWQAASRPSDSRNLSHTNILVQYRRSAYKTFLGYSNSGYTVSPAGRAGQATAARSGTDTAAQVTLATGAPAAEHVPAATLEVLYGIAEAGTYVSAPMDVFSLESEEPVSVFATHDSGGYYPVVTWALDQEYQLQSDAAQNYQWSMDQVYSLVFPVPEWTVDSEWSTLTYQGVEWPLESQWSTGEEQWGLDIFYALSGSQVLHEFKGHINTLRSGLDLPPYDICVRNLPDIAQRHSLHMRETLIQEHDGAHLPVGWQTFADRVTRLGDSYPAAENLASVWVLRNSNDQATALEYYDAWYASTEHYDNMVFDFGLDAILEFQLGIEYYLPYVVSGGTQYGPSETHWIAIATLNLINFNPPGDRVAVEFSLNSQYATYSPTRENLDMCWTTYAYKHVSTSHKTKYALRVAAAHSGSYGTYVTAAHTALLQYSIQVGLVAPYGSTVFISAQHVGAYDIEEYTRVVAAHTGEWAARLSCTHTAAYAASAEVLAGHSSAYGDKATTAAGHTAVYDETVAVRAWHTTPYSGAVPVRAGLVSPYALTAYALVGHTAKYSDQVPVVLGHTALYHILPYNPVRATHRAPYTLASGSSVELLGDFVVRLRGIEIDCKDVQLDMDEGDAFWTGALTLTSPEDFASIARGDPISVEFYGETFNLLVDSKSIARDSPADVSLSITALSPIAMLDGPGVPSISLTKTLPTSAQDLVEELLGQSVTWQVHSWTIPPYRYAVEDLTPLAAAKVVVEAIGAILRSTAEGTVAVSYRFPTSVPEYSATTPDFVVSDMEDNLSYRGRVQNMDVFNEFRVRDSDGAEADFFEWTPDEGSADSGILRAYLLPWRPAGVESRHTSEVPVNMVYLGVETRTETEEVEIVDGVGSLRFPAVAIASVEWLSSPLGSLYLENRTKDVRAEDTDTNWGYGLVRISYSVECLKYSVQAPTGTSVQFILVDRGI